MFESIASIPRNFGTTFSGAYQALPQPRNVLERVDRFALATTAAGSRVVETALGMSAATQLETNMMVHLGSLFGLCATNILVQEPFIPKIVTGVLGSLVLAATAVTVVRNDYSWQYEIRQGEEERRLFAYRPLTGVPLTLLTGFCLINGVQWQDLFLGSFLLFKFGDYLNSVQRGDVNPVADTKNPSEPRPPS